MVANCIDLEIAGRPLSTEIEIHEDGSASIRDDGPGISLSLEQLMTEGHTTPTADGHAPHVHLTMFGHGLVVVSALSERVEVRTRRGETMVRQIFSRGTVVSELELETEPPQFGTRIQFWPDPDIFEAFRWDLGSIQKRLHELVALRAQLSCRLVVGPQAFPARLDVSSLLTLSVQPLHEHAICIELTREHTTARVALRWYTHHPWWPTSVRSFCNLKETHEGNHVLGFQRGIGRVVAAAARDRFGNAWRRAYNHVSPSIAAVVAVEILDPQWGTPLKDRPSNPELAQIVEAAIMSELPTWFEQHPDVLAALLADPST